MIRTVHKIGTVLVLGIGVVHTVGTFFFYSGLSEAAIWFAGAGLGGIFVAFLNIGLWPPDTSVLSRRLAAAANFVFLLVGGRCFGYSRASPGDCGWRWSDYGDQRTSVGTQREEVNLGAQFA